MPRLMRIWRTTEEDGFNREAATDQVAAAGQQPELLSLPLPLHPSLCPHSPRISRTGVRRM